MMIRGVAGLRIDLRIREFLTCFLLEANDFIYAGVLIREFLLVLFSYGKKEQILIMHQKKKKEREDSKVNTNQYKERRMN